MAISGTKLDLLMNLTGTSNGELGKALSFDTSYISRIRSGKRGTPRHQPFVEPAAAYFVEKLTGDAMMQSIVAFLISKDTPWPADRETAVARLAEWLSFDIGDGDRFIEDFVRSFAAFQVPEKISVEPRAALPETTQHYFGNAGRREAMERFLSELLRQEQPGEVLFYTDEDTAWITEDADFLDFWWRSWLRFLRSGGKLCLIHTANRGLKEVLTEVRFYLPFYLTGGITPYFSPVLLDRIFCRTMFVQPGKVLLLGQSIGSETPIGSTFLVRHPETIRAMEEDYQRFRDLCIPLMRVLEPEEQKSLVELNFFYSGTEPHIHMGHSPLMGTLPESVIESIERRTHAAHLARELLDFREMLRTKLEARIHVTEILSLPTTEQIRAGEVMLPYSAALGEPTVFYEPDEFRRQLISVIHTLERYPNYHLILTDRVPENVDVFSKENATLLVRLGIGGRAFFIENRTADAFWHYLCHLHGQGKREAVLNALKTRIAELAH